MEATVATAGAARRKEVRRPTNEERSWGAELILIKVFGAMARAADCVWDSASDPRLASDAMHRRGVVCQLQRLN